MHLYIGYKNYSSWSLRPWLLMQVANIAFDETLLPIFHDDSLKTLAEELRIPAQVPILIKDTQVIWDTLAIAETLAELYPEKNLWPTDPSLRALARSATAEMHTGFTTLRSDCPMNCRAARRIEVTDALQGDLDRLAVVWDHFARHTANDTKGDAFLCGHFSIVDAFYAPVAVRIKGYRLSVSENFSAWSDALFALPAMQLWLKQASEESWSVAHYDAIGMADYG